MVAHKVKRSKLAEEEADQIDGELVLSIEKLQEIQDELEKMRKGISVHPCQQEADKEDFDEDNDDDDDDDDDDEKGTDEDEDEEENEGN